MKLGRAIRLERESKKILQTYLAHHCGVSAKHISNIESGKVVPTTMIMMTIEYTLGVQAGYFNELVKQELFDRWASKWET